MWFPVLVRQHVYIESVPWLLVSSVARVLTVELMSPCLHQERIHSTCAISVLRNDRKSNIFMFVQDSSTLAKKIIFWKCVVTTMHIMDEAKGFISVKHISLKIKAVSWVIPWKIKPLLIKKKQKNYIVLLFQWANVSKPFYVTSVGNSYRQISNIRRIRSRHLKDSRTVLRLPLPNPLKPDVKSRMKMWLEQRRQAMLQLHLSDRQFYCLLRCDLY